MMMMVVLMMVLMMVMEMRPDNVLQPNLSKLSSHKFLAFFDKYFWIHFDHFGRPANFPQDTQEAYIWEGVFGIFATTCLPTGRKLSVSSQNNQNGEMDLLGF